MAKEYTDNMDRHYIIEAKSWVDELPVLLNNIVSALGNKERRMAWESYAKENK